MFLFAGNARNTALAVAMDGASAEQRNGSASQRTAKRRARLGQRRQIGNEAAGERISDDNRDSGLDQRSTARSAFMLNLCTTLCQQRTSYAAVRSCSWLMEFSNGTQRQTFGAASYALVQVKLVERRNILK